ncbi:aldehyde dehydrogenase family protein [Nocardia pseudobrasiliensis]|uniref:Succinate-semialdehyde dehydrogenase/glutarate-semialdehyde dehydrogenase/succinate-semialdehyde dehydrogenase n=1 Tax=Nocardia pseudobrasiliensis TaxID=45979 RepID=A0A370IH13_9NOCA|nr:aldehyde dehydrogenase family protein [Nocardia pseudobrasiliensis]RDI68734.1 succinate-semialdehyde dehydrogenase/glutarate-semialdehyde dehydrogenase/succinate-semialdehyde dehydrogenase [Nocardia pseudobrasiliensis]
MITTIDPATGTPLANYPYTSEIALREYLRRAEAIAHGRLEPIDLRAKCFRTLGAQLRGKRDDLAHLITAEMGKPIAQARAEIDKCAVTCDHYADNLAELLTPQHIDLSPETGLIRLRPLGVILAIMPWNYPFWQVIRSMVPALAVGNTVLLKHADNVTGSAHAVRRLFEESFGPGVLTDIALPPDRIGPLIDDPAVAAVAFTGSNRVGALVAERAGRAVKKSVLELGGSDPFLVLADADIAAAAAAAVRSRFLNTGQSCIAAKRIIVQRDVFDDFVDAALAELGALTYGDPADPDTDLGPMARVDLRDELRAQLDATVGEGGRVLTGGHIDDRPGAWFPPTLVRVPATSVTAFIEETFGPLGAVLAVDSPDAAIAAANASTYGLSCSIWGDDPDLIGHVADRVSAGSVFVNRISESDPRLPVGGVKASGYGRELGAYGVAEFANVQAVRTAASSGA